MTDWTLATVEPAQIPRAAESLAQAFVEDAHTAGMLPPGRTFERLRVLLRAQLLETLAAGPHAVAATEDATGEVLGVALWQAPSTGPTRWSMAKNLPAYLRMLGRRFPDAVRTSATEARHRPRVPHWYLGYLGTRPAARGRGVGTALIRYGLDRAERADVGAYLESSSRANVDFYRTLGFVEMGRIPAAGTEPTYAMWYPVR